MLQPLHQLAPPAYPIFSVHRGVRRKRDIDTLIIAIVIEEKVWTGSKEVTGMRVGARQSTHGKGELEIHLSAQQAAKLSQGLLWNHNLSQNYQSALLHTIKKNAPRFTSRLGSKRRSIYTLLKNCAAPKVKWQLLGCFLHYLDLFDKGWGV